MSQSDDLPVQHDVDVAAVTGGANTRARWMWALRLATGAALLGVLLWRGDVSSLHHALGTVSPFVLFGSVLFYLAGQVLSAWKWQLLLRARKVHVSLGECCRLYLIGMFWNLWMPTNIGGDAVRAWMTAPRSGGLTNAASSILVERLTGFLALAGLAVAGLLFDSGRHRGSNAAASQIVLAMLLLFAGLFIVLLLLHLRFSRRPAGEGGKVQRKLAQATAALAFYADGKHRGTLWAVMLLSFLFQASQVVLNIALARATGLNVPANTFWWLIPVLALASLIPVGIGGLGVREAAAVTLLHGASLLVGDHTGTIVAWSLLWQATIWLASLPGGIWAVRGRQPSGVTADS